MRATPGCVCLGVSHTWHTHTHTHTFEFMCLFLHACRSVFVPVFLCLNLCLCLHLSLCVCVCVCVRACPPPCVMCVCVKVYAWACAAVNINPRLCVFPLTVRRLAIIKSNANPNIGSVPWLVLNRAFYRRHHLGWSHSGATGNFHPMLHKQSLWMFYYVTYLFTNRHVSFQNVVTQAVVALNCSLKYR